MADDVVGGPLDPIEHFGSRVVTPAMSGVRQPSEVAGPARAWAPAPYPGAAYNPGQDLMQELVGAMSRLSDWHEGMTGSSEFYEVYVPLMGTRVQEFDHATAAQVRKLLDQLERQVPAAHAGPTLASAQ